MIATPRYALAVAVLSTAALAHGAELAVSPLERNGDGALEATVSLTTSGGEAVGALQFDLEYDRNALEFERVVTGPTADAADKSANFNEYTPGKVRVIVAGLNRNRIGRGPIAVAKFKGEAQSIALTRVILSDPFGAEVPVTVLQANDTRTTPVQPAAPEHAAGPSSLAAWAVSLVVLLGLAFALHRVLFAKPNGRRA